MPRLTRVALARAGGVIQSPPERIVHLGVGAFHRAHQAWYTARADDAEDWGIAAFTGRTPGVAEALAPQGGVYTLVERGAGADRFEHIGSIVSVQDGRGATRAIARAETAVVTITVTEGGYALGPDGEPRVDDPALASDLAALRTGAGLSRLPARSTAVRLLAGLDSRRRAAAGGISIVPCDNVPGNGQWLRHGLTALAGRIVPELVPWLSDNVSFLSTSVDRITPRSGDDVMREVAEATGWVDRAPVVTEPFSDWVLSGEFVGASPDWASAGATYVSDIAAYESRKLWMLNGAHTILAALGRLRGHVSVASAIDDPVCRAAVEGFWASVRPHLPSSMSTGPYADSLIDRFRNVRMEHRLAQISADAVGKIRVRILPIVRRQLVARRPIDFGARAVAAWIECVRRGCAGPDVEAAAISAALGEREPDAALMNVIDADLAGVDAYRIAVQEALTDLRYGSATIETPTS